MGGRDRSEMVCGTLAASNENDKLDFWWMDLSTSRMDGVGKIGEKWEQSDERDLARSGLADWSSWSVRREQITPCDPVMYWASTCRCLQYQPGTSQVDFRWLGLGGWLLIPLPLRVPRPKAKGSSLQTMTRAIFNSFSGAPVCNSAPLQRPFHPSPSLPLLTPPRLQSSPKVPYTTKFHQDTVWLIHQLDQPQTNHNAPKQFIPTPFSISPRFDLATIRFSGIDSMEYRQYS